MSFESALIWFSILTLIMISFEIFFTYATLGFGYGFSSNRAAVEISPLATRIKRALQNQTESAVYIVPVLAAGAVMGVQGQGVETAALLIVLARAAFALLYYSGIPFARVPAFALGTVSTLYIAYVLVTVG
jgi:uncharacterized MAPEG superfamily protein